MFDMKNVELCNRNSIKCKEAQLVLRNNQRYRISKKSQRFKIGNLSDHQLKKLNRVICGDAYKKLQKLPDNSIDVCYLDPPFFAKRIFEVETKDGQFNYFDDRWENNISKYLDYMVRVFCPVRV